MQIKLACWTGELKSNGKKFSSAINCQEVRREFERNLQGTRSGFEGGPEADSEYTRSILETDWKYTQSGFETYSKHTRRHTQNGTGAGTISANWNQRNKKNTARNEEECTSRTGFKIETEKY